MRLLFRLIALAGIMAAAVFVGRGLLPSADREGAKIAPEVRVRIASRNLPAGTFLDEPEAPFTIWKEPVTGEMVPSPASSTHDVIGAVIIAPIKAGQPILRSQLLLPGQDGFLAAVLHAGMRAVSVAVDAVSGNAGHIFPGDRVDLILTQTLNPRDPSASIRACAPT
jgi:pilus assembly protein CpaB